MLRDSSNPRSIGRGLWWVGVCALSWCAVVMGWSRIYQVAGGRELDQKIAAVSKNRRPDPPLVPAPGSVIGRLVISRLGVSAIAYEGVEDTLLRMAVGHIPGTALPPEMGNAAFAAHRDTFFRNLDHLHRNDAIRLTSPSGTFLYRVEWSAVVKPEATWVLEPTGSGSLTLVTCYPFHYVGPAPLRFVVRARLVES